MNWLLFLFIFYDVMLKGLTGFISLFGPSTLYPCDQQEHRDLSHDTCLTYPLLSLCFEEVEWFSLLRIAKMVENLRE